MAVAGGKGLRQEGRRPRSVEVVVLLMRRQRQLLAMSCYCCCSVGCLPEALLPPVTGMQPCPRTAWSRYSQGTLLILFSARITSSAGL